MALEPLNAVLALVLVLAVRRRRDVLDAECAQLVLKLRTVFFPGTISLQPVETWRHVTAEVVERFAQARRGFIGHRVDVHVAGTIICPYLSVLVSSVARADVAGDCVCAHSERLPSLGDSPLEAALGGASPCELLKRRTAGRSDGGTAVHVRLVHEARDSLFVDLFLSRGLAPRCCGAGA